MARLALGFTQAVGALLLAAACGHDAPHDAPAPDAVVTKCELGNFAATVSVAEASGAAMVVEASARRLLIHADSGGTGAYVAVDPETGTQVRAGQFPLGASADDIEGLAPLGDDVIGIISAGWIYRWRYNGGGYDLVAGPTPLGPVDDSIPLNGGLGDTPPPATAGMVCGATGVNCGHNYEGICLSRPLPTAPGACVGMVVAKADGKLFCLVNDGALGLQIDRTRAIDVALPGSLADCSIDDAGRVWIGSNGFSGNVVYVVSAWQTEVSQAVVRRLGQYGAAFDEAIWFDGAGATGTLFRFSDNGMPGPSTAARWTCHGL